ncbi:MAG TPA: hypothetical protein VLF39_01395 [Candidatus Saccharimonadales bacterium]|nr:hypothetical protein [Candidatus Saccharimonadales bacterium]
MSKTVKRKYTQTEADGAFFLKLVIYLIVGFQWVRLVNVDATKQLPLPVGLIIGLIIASRDKFKIDRKLEYVILLISMLIGFWSQVGIYLRVLK